MSDFIVEHSGLVWFWEFLCNEQMKLPVEPTCPISPYASAIPPAATAAAASTAKKGWGRKSREKAPQPSKHCTLEPTNEWVPPPPPAPFESYHLSCFDAHQIIHPGANYNPWWDMPQLIAQVCNLLSMVPMSILTTPS